MKKRSSIRLRLLMGCCAAIFGAAMFAYIQFSRIAVRYAVEATRERADALATSTALTVAPFLAPDKPAELGETLDLLKSQADFSALQIKDPSGATLALIRAAIPPPGDVYSTTMPIFNHGQKLGNITLTFSLRRMQVELTNVCRSYFFLVLAIGTLALFLMYRLIQRLVVDP